MKRSIYYRIKSKPRWMSLKFAKRMIRWRMKMMTKRIVIGYKLSRWTKWRINRRNFNPSIIPPCLILVMTWINDSLTTEWILVAGLLILDAFIWQSLNKGVRYIFLKLQMEVARLCANFTYTIGIRYEVKVEKLG